MALRHQPPAWPGDSPWVTSGRVSYIIEQEQNLNLNFECSFRIPWDSCPDLLDLLDLQDLGFFLFVAELKAQ